MKIALAALITLSSCTPAIAGYQPGYSNQRSCFKTEYREEYIPGTEDNPGYVKSWKDTVEVPCEDVSPDVGWRRHPSPSPSDRPYYR